MLLLAAAPPARAAGKAAKGSDYKEIPAINWNLVSSGFIEAFKLRNHEIAGSLPNRFFPDTAALALGHIDGTGHYLLMKCGSVDNCEAKRDALEDRMVFVTLLEVVHTPRAKKSQLFNEYTWELTPLGEKYIDILVKRHPDLTGRLARLVAASFASR